MEIVRYSFGNNTCCVRLAWLKHQIFLLFNFFFLPLFMGLIALFDTIYVMSSIVLFKLPFSFIYSIFN